MQRLTLLTRVSGPGARGPLFWLLLAVCLVGLPKPAEAQLDPLLIIKRTLPTLTTAAYRTHVIVAVDTSRRMQSDADGNYYDPNDYAAGNLWDSTLGVSASATKFRRIYKALTFPSGGSPKYETSTIAAVGNDSATAYANFYAATRMGVARAALAQAVGENTTSARFGVVAMRQSNPRIVSALNDGDVQDDDLGQGFPTDGVGPGLWKITRPVVDTDNAAAPAATPRVKSDSATANADVLTLVGKTPSTSGALLPAGNDAASRVDAPLAYLVSDLKTEASRIITADTYCRNTIAVLITGGGEGNSATPASSAASLASGFLSISSRRVPIYVIAIAPPASEVAQLQAIAANSGGQYFEVSSSEIAAAVAAGVPVPKVVRAIDTAVQHGFASPSDVNTAPTASLPYGPQTEYQVTSPIVGTVNLQSAVSLAGATLPNTKVTNTLSGEEIPQRANVMVTSGFALPGFDMRLRAFRVYKPVADTTKPSGYRFDSDGTALWVAKSPMADYCNDATASCRNIFTVLPNGTMVAFTAANAATLSPYLNSWDAAGLIDFIRTQPLGPIVSSTPAFMDPPSLDPPPDPDYPVFSEEHKDRALTMIFVGANDGMMHAIDGRTGVEVWAFVPFNLLPKLRTLRDGQPIDGFAYAVDASAKVADVKLNGSWRTMVVFGEGPGGTFYQAFDASLDDIQSSIPQDSDSVSTLLSYFSDSGRIPLLWAFPQYSHFDYTTSTTAAPYGDLNASSTATERTVGQTWSDPAIGQVKDTTGKFTMVVGSGFLPRSVENGTVRAGVSAGRNLYLLDLETGLPFATTTSSPASDGVAETDDDCQLAAYGCTKFKNALQADPVATGPSDSRFITMAYIGDSRRQHLAVRHQPRHERELHLQRVGGEALWRRRRPAHLLVDGRRVGEQPGVHLRRDRQRPAAVQRGQHAVQAARRPRPGHNRQQDLRGGAHQDRRHRRRREGLVVPGGGGRHRVLQHDVLQAAGAVHQCRRQPVRADVHRRRRLRRDGRRQGEQERVAEGQDPGGCGPRDGAVHRGPAPGVRRGQQD